MNCLSRSTHSVLPIWRGEWSAESREEEGKKTRFVQPKESCWSLFFSLFFFFIFGPWCTKIRTWRWRPRRRVLCVMHRIDRCELCSPAKALLLERHAWRCMATTDTVTYRELEGGKKMTRWTVLLIDCRPLFPPFRITCNKRKFIYFSLAGSLNVLFFFYLYLR